MSKFTGGTRVRCVDCVNLEGQRCTVKASKVALKKKRLCSLYIFKGSYENRKSMEAMYVPHLDSNTKRMMNKMLKLGVIPVSSKDEAAPAPQGFKKVKSVPMPASTATAVLLGQAPIVDNTTKVDLPLPGEVEEDPGPWLPNE